MALRWGTDGCARGEDGALRVDVEVHVAVNDFEAGDNLASIDVGDAGVLVGVRLGRGGGSAWERRAT
jgi:hypothetical protein